MGQLAFPAHAYLSPYKDLLDENRFAQLFAYICDLRTRVIRMLIVDSQMGQADRDVSPRELQVVPVGEPERVYGDSTGRTVGTQNTAMLQREYRVPKSQLSGL